MAKRFANVIGVEENREAIRYLKQNKARDSTMAIEFSATASAIFLKATSKAKRDPLRSGAEDHTIEFIPKMARKHVSSVSFDRLILARDLGVLIDRGCEIDTITAVDLFPQTQRVETVVRLRNNSE